MPERIDLERQALGSDFVESLSAAWNVDMDSRGRSPNILGLTEKTAEVADAIHERLTQGGRLAGTESEEYEALVDYHLYQRYRGDFEALTLAAGAPRSPIKFYSSFCRDVEAYLQPARGSALSSLQVAHLFAGLWQVERAFINIFQNIVGSSASIARLRAAVWESIFTYHFKRHREGLYEGMRHITTLITGPSGTGKELVAKAIAC